MADQMVCPICGKATSSYMGHYRKDHLCKEHAMDLKAGKLIQCIKCGQWHSPDAPCICPQKAYAELPTTGFTHCICCEAETSGYAFCLNCFKKHTKSELLELLNNSIATISKKEEPTNAKSNTPVKSPVNPNNVVIISPDNKSKCITCGRKTDGLLFCPNCYSKYKDKNLYFKISKCTSVELLDSEYEGKFTCDDGHVVKSKSEREIDNYLFEHHIPHAYEAELSYGREKNETLHPDFYMPDYLGEGKDVYIEHWGYDENNIQYTKTKKFKMPIYREKGITLVCTYEKSDMGNIRATLNRKLAKENIIPNQINFEEH